MFPGEVCPKVYKKLTSDSNISDHYSPSGSGLIGESCKMEIYSTLLNLEVLLLSQSSEAGILLLTTIFSMGINQSTKCRGISDSLY